MSDTVFRQASEPVEKAPTPEPIKDSPSPVTTHIDSLLATYQDDQGKPYTSKYFDVENVWDQEPSLKRDLQEIEGYLQDQVKKGRLDNSTKAADQFIREMERKAGLSRYETGAARISKILAYIDFKRVVDE